MKQALVKGGNVIVEEVPAPVVGEKNVLVKVLYSCISVGTEMAGVKSTGQSLCRRILKQPEKVKMTLQMMKEQGVKSTLGFVKSRLEVELPTGYSAAGEVIAVGSLVEGISVGELVACAGAGIANHAEVIDVPVNLVAKIPEGVEVNQASTVTLGAIAMQGVRRTEPTLGETVVVVGLGILGQITEQLLRANGCRVIGVDIDPDRVDLALENGMNFGVDPSKENYVERVHKLTDGFGCDAVVVTAASQSNKIISDAMKSCRRKGRVVLVGDVGLDLDRADMYMKELDFYIATSYGPGRYDPSYEIEGNDYPLPYVRWTENRNMEEYLNLIRDGKIVLNGMEPKVYSIDDASSAFSALKDEGKKPLLVLLKYDQDNDKLERKIQVTNKAIKKDQIQVAIIGAGAFAQSFHIPNIEKQSANYSIRSIMGRTGANAKAISKRCGAAYATTDYSEVLNDESIDLVLISTRHNLHAKMALQALEAGKNVFVEKPLALNSEELLAIKEFYSKTQQAPALMTGYNRRFSPAITKAKEILANKTTPLLINYRMNAGYIPLDSWVHGEEGGGRNIGEACHIYDLFVYLTNSKVKDIKASSIEPSGKQWARNDNFVAVISFEDGSVCSLTYTSLGNSDYPKERMDIYSDGKVITLDDYKALSVTGGNHKGWESSVAQKGHFEELDSLATSIKKGGEWPISIEEQIDVMNICFEVEKQITAKV